jgi:NADH dehydrogenase [ubiquinone] 1 alpha subcomplex assembly factor 1
MKIIENLPAKPQPHSERVIFDFSNEQQTALWLPMNDVVMGGISSGSMTQHSSQTALFSGVVSLENGGGFASVRTRPAEYNFAGCSGLTLIVKGDGKKYKVNLTDSASRGDVLFQAKFSTVLSQWIALYIPFKDFVPTFRGRPLPDYPPLNANRIQTFGLMISEGQPGEFELEVGSVAAKK